MRSLKIVTGVPALEGGALGVPSFSPIEGNSVFDADSAGVFPDVSLATTSDLPFGALDVPPRGPVSAIYCGCSIGSVCEGRGVSVSDF